MQDHPAFMDIVASELEGVEGRLFEGMGTFVMLQASCRSLAEMLSTRLIHLNSGLNLYGADKLGPL